MATLRNPVEPWRGTGFATLTDDPTVTGGTGIFGLAASLRNIVADDQPPVKSPQGEIAVIPPIDPDSAWGMGGGPLGIENWLPEGYEEWWVDRERERLGLEPSDPLPDDDDEVVPQTPEEAAMEAIKTGGSGGNLKKRYNSNAGAIATALDQGEGGSGWLRDTLDKIPDRVKWTAAGYLANSVIPGAGVALGLGRRAWGLLGDRDLPSNEGAMSYSAFNSLPTSAFAFESSGGRDLRSSNVGIGRTPDGVTSAQLRAIHNTGGGNDRDRNRNRNNPGGGGDSQAGGGINSGGGNPRSSADISPGRGG